MLTLSAPKAHSRGHAQDGMVAVDVLDEDQVTLSVRFCVLRSE